MMAKVLRTFERVWRGESGNEKSWDHRDWESGMAESNGMTVFDAVGEEGFQRLVAAFYRRIPEDDLLGPMYPANEMVESERRLRDFLVYRFGGPQRYIVERGHPKLRMRHMPFRVDNAARDRWMQLMTAALDETQLMPEADRFLREFFEQTATFLRNAEG
jgi:hemoglobin